MAYSVDNYTAADMLTLSWEMMKKEWKDIQTPPDTNFLSDFFWELKIRSQLCLKDVYVIVLMILMFSAYRYILIKFVIKPVTRYYNFGQREIDKFKESGCKLSSYLLFFLISYHLVNVSYPHLQFDLSTQWAGYFQTMPVPDDIKLLFYLEAGYYFHAIYTTYYLDVWKKDSVAMIIHHVLANCLIIFSFATRYHRIGLVVMYLHDGADVILEASKLILCFKQKLGWPIFTYLSNIGFVLFSSNWFWYRLVVYPQIVLFSSFYVARKILIGKVASFYFTFNIMLSFLLCLNIFWFHFIVLLFIRIATGKTKEIEDTREYNHDGQLKEKSNHSGLNGTVHCNGYVKEQKNGNLKMKANTVATEVMANGTTDLHRRKEN